MLTGAAILAAGPGTRFVAAPNRAGPKPLAVLAGRPLITWAVDAALASGTGPVAVVLGAAAGEIEAVLPAGATVLVNTDWSRGMSTSLEAAARWAVGNGLEALAVALGDQPLITAAAWQRVAHAPPGPLAVATYDGRRGHPVRVGPPLLAAVAGGGVVAGDAGLRHLLAQHAVVEVACDGLGAPDDVDTPDDLARLEARWPHPRGSGGAPGSASPG